MLGSQDVSKLPILNVACQVQVIEVYVKGFARGSIYSVFLAFSQSYVEHDLRKNKIEVHFFTNRLIFMSNS
jgi:hypothetical protein